MTNIQPFPNLPAHIANLQRQGIELRLRRSRDGDFTIQPSLYNAVLLLSRSEEYRNRIVYDDFAEKIYIIVDGNTEEVQDYHIDAIRFDMEDRLFTTFKKEEIYSALEIVSKRNAINPLADFVTRLHWDGKPRLDTVLTDYFGVEDTTLHRAYSKCFIISMIARIFATIHTPVKVDTVLVLYGKQGKLKSTALGIIALEHIFGKKYFSDTPFDMGSKDAHLMTQGKILVELQELAKRSKDKEVEKSFISLQIAEYRPPFRRCRVQQVRKCIFVATTNKNMILTDATGSRRFWPVIVGKEYEDQKNWKIDTAGLQENIEQIWAEALHRFQSNESWWLSDAQENLRIEAAADFTDQHPLHEKIADIAETFCSDKGYVQVEQIIAELYKNPLNNLDTKYLEKSTRQNKAIITDVLTEEKYEYKRQTVNGKVVRGWTK
jgi:predicted P-loop ATPase